MHNNLTRRFLFGRGRGSCSRGSRKSRTVLITRTGRLRFRFWTWRADAADRLRPEPPSRCSRRNRSRPPPSQPDLNTLKIESSRDRLDCNGIIAEFNGNAIRRCQQDFTPLFSALFSQAKIAFFVSPMGGDLSAAILIDPVAILSPRLGGI
jgi:hypothetical protein